MLDEKDMKYLQEMESRLLTTQQQMFEKLAAKIEDSKEESAANMRVLLESYVEPKFNLLAEGHKAIVESMTPKSEIEDLREEMQVFKLALRTLSQDVAELKKAQ